MLIKALGVIDIVIGIIFVFASNIEISYPVLIILGMILLAKSSLGMLKDFASWIDFLGGISLLLMAVISVPAFILFILGLLLLQKGFFSLA
tara:strand:- start:396 stop:668 length:273 start_codon:yes stop_codon:yes gene_type:complete